jgi:hypothetical protein
MFFRLRIARNILEGETGGVESGAMLVADADFIHNGGAFIAMVAAVAPYYVGAGAGNQDKINSFLQRYSFLNECSPAAYEEGIYAATIELRRLLVVELGIRLERIKQADVER